MSTPKDVAQLCERIGEVLRDAAGHDDARQALVAVLARWVAIGALQDDSYADKHMALGAHFSRATVELHLSSESAFRRLHAGWRDRN